MKPLRRFFSTLLIPVIIFMGITPPPTILTPVEEAQATVIDVPNMVKEYGLDVVGWVLGDIILQLVTEGTVDWAATGFGALERVVGSVTCETVSNPTALGCCPPNTNADANCLQPDASLYTSDLSFVAGDASFAVNPKGFFDDLRVRGAQGVYSELRGLTLNDTNGDGFDDRDLNKDGVIDGAELQGIGETAFNDFNNELLRYVAQNMQREYDGRYNELTANEGFDKVAYDAFVSGASDGFLWDTWFNSFQTCAAQATCSVEVIQQEVEDRQAELVKQTEDDLSQSGGYLSMRTCSMNVNQLESGAIRNSGQSKADASGCLQYDSVTPGSVVGDLLHQSLRAGNEKNAMIDELSELFAVLVGALIDKVLQDGLLGASGLSSDTEGARNIFTDGASDVQGGDLCNLSGTVGTVPTAPSYSFDGTARDRTLECNSSRTCTNKPEYWTTDADDNPIRNAEGQDVYDESRADYDDRFTRERQAQRRAVDACRAANDRRDFEVASAEGRAYAVGVDVVDDFWQPIVPLQCRLSVLFPSGFSAQGNTDGSIIEGPTLAADKSTLVFGPGVYQRSIYVEHNRTSSDGSNQHMVFAPFLGSIGSVNFNTTLPWQNIIPTFPGRVLPGRDQDRAGLWWDKQFREGDGTLNAELLLMLPDKSRTGTQNISIVTLGNRGRRELSGVLSIDAIIEPDSEGTPINAYFAPGASILGQFDNPPVLHETNMTTHGNIAAPAQIRVSSNRLIYGLLDGTIPDQKVNTRTVYFTNTNPSIADQDNQLVTLVLSVPEATQPIINNIDGARFTLYGSETKAIDITVRDLDIVVFDQGNETDGRYAEYEVNYELYRGDPANGNVIEPNGEITLAIEERDENRQPAFIVDIQEECRRYYDPSFTEEESSSAPITYNPPAPGQACYADDPDWSLSDVALGGRHQYSNITLFNSDDTLMLLSGGVIKRVDNLENLRTISFPSGHRTWSYTDPDKIISVDHDRSRVYSYDVQTGNRVEIADLSDDYSETLYGPWEGKLSQDDRYIALLATSGNDNEAVVVDLTNGNVVQTIPVSGDIDYVTMTPSGRYVAIDQRDEGHISIHSRSTGQKLREVPRGHADFTFTESGREVIVTRNIQNYTDIETGAQVATNVSPSSGAGHVSCQAHRRRGWCAFSPESSSGEVFAFSLDGSGDREVHGNYSGGSSYNQQSQVNISSYGDKVMFRPGGTDNSQLSVASCEA